MTANVSTAPFSTPTTGTTTGIVTTHTSTAPKVTFAPTEQPSTTTEVRASTTDTPKPTTEFHESTSEARTSTTLTTRGSSTFAPTEPSTDAISYTAWVELNGLSGSSADKTADPERDGLLNFDEYALGTDPTKVDNKVEIVVVNGAVQLVLPRQARTEVFYQILRSSDAAAGNEYEDWEILASRWNTDSWVGNHAVDNDAPSVLDSSVRLVRFTIPAAYTSHQFRVTVTDPSEYPAFSWDKVGLEMWLVPKRPVEPTPFTKEDIDFIASVGISNGGLVAIPETTGKTDFDDLGLVQDKNPRHKHIDYINGGIVPFVDINYEGLAYEDLSYAKFAVYYDDTATYCDIPVNDRSRPCIDYRKPAGLKRQCDIVSAYRAQGPFVFRFPPPCQQFLAQRIRD